MMKIIVGLLIFVIGSVSLFLLDSLAIENERTLHIMMEKDFIDFNNNGLCQKEKKIEDMKNINEYTQSQNTVLSEDLKNKIVNGKISYQEFCSAIIMGGNAKQSFGYLFKNL